MDAVARVEELIAGHGVVLFMKGTPAAPACAFSERALDILEDYPVEPVAVDVTVDPTLRRAAEQRAGSATMPQVFVDGRPLGGADALRALSISGELATLLGVEMAPAPRPEVTVTEAAARALATRVEGDEGATIRLEIDRRFVHRLSRGAAEPLDVELPLGDVTLVMDRPSARRADGLVIDHRKGPAGEGFVLDNPGAPPQVRDLCVEELAELLRAGKPLEVFDVRTAHERRLASLPDTVAFDDAGRRRLEALEPHTAVAFLCHHGIRSRVAAEHCVRAGFREVYNIVGGIDAWSLRVDPSVPRY